MIRWQGQFRRVPVRSLAFAAQVSEQRVLKRLLNFSKRQLQWPMLFVVVDQGYVNGDMARLLRREWHVAFVVRPKKKMRLPENCAMDGCPACPLGESLIWEDYNAESEQLIYRGNLRLCGQCPLAGTCPKQFEYDAGQHETYWGMVPGHSRLARMLLRYFRPQIEAGFNLTKNRYGVKGAFLNSRDLAQTFCLLSDILETLSLLAAERPSRGRETKTVLVAEICQPELWD